MIGQLRGRLADKRPNQVMVDVGGVGYLVAVPLSTFAALGELHTEVTLLIHTHVREDALSLYGFLSSRETHLFEMLLSASGVGPRLACRSRSRRRFRAHQSWLRRSHSGKRRRGRQTRSRSFEFRKVAARLAA